MKIEIASDVMCPWCVIGYKNLSNALEQLQGVVEAEIEFHAFELNPNMPAEGQNTHEHLAEKYGVTPEQSRETEKRITQLGQQAGFTFNFADDSRMINTFDCHRLLVWAKQFNRQAELKMAMFTAHFTDNRRLNDVDELLSTVESVGLDRAAAHKILDSDAFAQDVRDDESRMHQMGIHSVPTFIINRKYTISGGQLADTFVQALRQIQSE